MNFGGRQVRNPNFKKEIVILWDIFPVQDGETVLITFESAKSSWRQGIWLMCDQGIEINGQYGKSVVLWYENSKRQIQVICHTLDGFLNIYNVWDRGLGQNSQGASSGMLVEELTGNGRRYKCNDVGFEANFDKLIFRIEHLQVLENRG